MLEHCYGNLRDINIYLLDGAIGDSDRLESLSWSGNRAWCNWSDDGSSDNGSHCDSSLKV